jgi:hypothetical protein
MGADDEWCCWHRCDSRRVSVLLFTGLLSESQRAYEKFSFFLSLTKPTITRRMLLYAFRMCMIRTEGFGVRVHREMGNGAHTKRAGKMQEQEGNRERKRGHKSRETARFSSVPSVVFFYL